MIPLLEDTIVINIDEVSVEVKDAIAITLRNKATQITFGAPD